MIKYVKRAMKKPISKQIKYYPMIAACTPITIKDVVAQIEKTSTVSSADIKATIDSLEFVVIQALKDGKSVRLGDLGSFRPTFTSNGVLNAKDVSATLIKDVRVRFTPSSKMRLELSTDNVSFSEEKGGVADGE